MQSVAVDGTEVLTEWMVGRQTRSRRLRPIKIAAPDHDRE